MKICEMCASTVFGERYIRSPIAALERPFGDQREHLALALGQLVERTARALAGDEPRDDRRIDHALALADPPQRVGEHGDIRDALLQQVAGPLGHLLQQPHRVVRLQVMREHEHPDLRVAAADLLRGHQPVVGVGRRHADVHDGDLRAPRVDHPQQLRRRRRNARRPRSPRPRAAARDRRAAASRRRRSGLARQLREQVVGGRRERPADGAHPILEVGGRARDPAGRLEPDDQPPVLARAPRPRRRRRRSGAATRRPRSRPPTPRARRSAARAGSPTTRRGDRSASASTAGRRPSWASTAGISPWASSRSSASAAPQTLLGGGELGVEARVAGRQLPPRQPDRDRQRGQPLLGPVVQIALERAALGVRRGDDACARARRLCEMRAPDRAQALVLERQASGVGELGGDRGLLEQTGAVHDGGELAAAREQLA